MLYAWTSVYNGRLIDRRIDCFHVIIFRPITVVINLMTNCSFIPNVFGSSVRVCISAAESSSSTGEDVRTSVARPLLT